MALSEKKKLMWLGLITDRKERLEDAGELGGGLFGGDGYDGGDGFGDGFDSISGENEGFGGGGLGGEGLIPGGSTSENFGDGFSGGEGYDGTFGEEDSLYSGDFGSDSFEEEPGIPDGSDEFGGYGGDSSTIGPGMSSDRLSSETNESAAGIRVFEEAGVTYDGESVPAGAVEVFGNEVHFSNTGPTKSAPEPPDLGTEEIIDIKNLRASGDDIEIGNQTTLTVDIQNNGDYTEKVGIILEMSDTQHRKQSIVVVGPGGTTSHEFTVQRDFPGNVRFDIADESVFVNWVVAEDTDESYNNLSRLKGGVENVEGN